MIGRGSNAGIREMAEASTVAASSRNAIETIDHHTLFSEYVRLKQQLFIIEQRLNGDRTDSDQLLAEWYASDEFSSLMEKHAAIAKQVALAGTGH